MNENVRQNDTTLNIEPGVQANVQIGRLDDNQRLQATFIGCLHGKSVIITMPTHRSNDVQCYFSDRLTLRYFLGREIHGFKSEVIGIVKAPYSYLHLSYPKHVEKVRIRSEPRLQAGFSARVLIGDSETPVEGRVVDISTQGAKLWVPQSDLEAGAKLNLQFEVPMGQKAEAMSINSEVRSVRPTLGEAPGLACGLSFVELDESDRLLLSSYVYEMIMDQRLTGTEN